MEFQSNHIRVRPKIPRLKRENIHGQTCVWGQKAIKKIYARIGRVNAQLQHRRIFVERFLGLRLF